MARNVLNDKQRIKFHTSETIRVYTSENSTILIRFFMTFLEFIVWNMRGKTSFNFVILAERENEAGKSFVRRQWVLKQEIVLSIVHREIVYVLSDHIIKVEHELIPS
jgi:hypothetical protein